MEEFTTEISVKDSIRPTLQYAEKISYSSTDEIQKFRVYFSKEMDLETVLDPNNYIVKVGNKVNDLADYNYVEINPLRNKGDVVEFAVSIDKAANQITEITALKLKDVNGLQLENAGTFKTLTDEKTIAVNDDPIKVTNKDKIVVEFNNEVLENSVDKTKFVKQDGSSLKIDNVKVDGKKVTLELEEKTLTDNFSDFKIKVLENAVTGLNGKANLSKENIEVKNNIDLKLEKVTFVDATEPKLTLEFNRTLEDADLEGSDFVVNAKPLSGKLSVSVKEAKIVKEGEESTKVNTNKVEITLNTINDFTGKASFEVIINNNSKFKAANNVTLKGEQSKISSLVDVEAGEVAANEEVLNTAIKEIKDIKVANEELLTPEGVEEAIKTKLDDKLVDGMTLKVEKTDVKGTFKVTLEYKELSKEIKSLVVTVTAE